MTGNDRAYAGQKFVPSARVWNSFIDAAERSTVMGARRGSLERATVIFNDGGSDLDLYGILGIDDVAITQADNALQFANRIVLDGSTPDLADHVGNFAVLLEPSRSFAFSRCTTDGLVQVQVDVTDTDHDWCDIKDGESSELSSYAAGSARIVHKPSGTGVKWCVVQLNQSYGPAREYTGLINDTDGFTDADATTAMDGLEAVDGVPVETALATVHNIYDLHAGDNVEARARYNHKEKRWELVEVAAYKPLVRFTLDNALTTSEASNAATITDQYGPGINQPTTSITVHNMEIHTSSTYMFEGDSGDAGLATWDSGTNYVIVNMECD